jgi:two-component system, LytTR family, response regulator LytT
MNVVIIEDEIMSAEDLADTIKAVESNVTITAILPSVQEAVAYLQTSPDIDLIFSDIQLGDGLSFEIYNQVSVRVPVIFCTAFDEYAIEAFKNNGIDYILKPFNNEAVTTAIARFKQLKQYFTPKAVDYELLISKLSGSSAKPANTSILVYQKDKVLPVRLEDIALFYIDKDIIRLLCFNRKSYIVGQTLDELEHMTDGNFFRANRQHLVNRQAVVDAAAHFPRKYIINLSVDFPETIIVSKNRVADFLNWLRMN